MDFEPTLSAAFAVYVRDYLMDHGVKPDPVFAGAGILLTSEEGYDAPLPVRKVAALFELAASATGKSDMGMKMGQGYHYESGSLLILAMLAAPSVGEGIRCLNRYDKYVDTAIETSFDFDLPTAEFGARLLAEDDVQVDQLNEYLMAFLVQALRMATRKEVPLKEVWLCHANEQNRTALEQFFNAPVKFSQAYNKLLFDRSFLQERFFTSNRLLFDILTNALKTYFFSVGQQSGFIDVVSREITRLAGEELASTEVVAKRLAISPRTLRRKLADEGYSFQEAKNMAREKRAKYYLSQTNMPLSEIAFELGYSELSAFSRAFRAWAGETPQSYREHYKQLSGG